MLSNVMFEGLKEYFSFGFHYYQAPRAMSSWNGWGSIVPPCSQMNIRKRSKYSKGENIWRSTLEIEKLKVLDGQIDLTSV